MSEDDKYPPESGRRRFVKGVVGGGALAGVGATGAVSVNTLTTASGAGGGTVKARVVENTGGPAPRGMPQIPIEIDADGFIKGIWPEITTEKTQGVEYEIAKTEDFKGSGVAYSQEWFQYCGLESNNALTPSYESDNYFVATEGPDYAWQQEAKSEGDRFNISDFDDYTQWENGIGKGGLGKPAQAKWRSADSENLMPVAIMRSDAIKEAAKDPRLFARSPPKQPMSDRSAFAADRDRARTLLDDDTITALHLGVIRNDEAVDTVVARDPASDYDPSIHTLSLLATHIRAVAAEAGADYEAVAADAAAIAGQLDELPIEGAADEIDTAMADDGDKEVSEDDTTTPEGEDTGDAET